MNKLPQIVAGEKGNLEPLDASNEPIQLKSKKSSVPPSEPLDSGDPSSLQKNEVKPQDRQKKPRSYSKLIRDYTSQLDNKKFFGLKSKFQVGVFDTVAKKFERVNPTEVAKNLKTRVELKNKGSENNNKIAVSPANKDQTSKNYSVDNSNVSKTEEPLNLQKIEGNITFLIY